MNKKEVGLLLMAATGRVLCHWGDFHNWSERRLGRSIDRKEFPNRKLREQLNASITDKEWEEIATFFMG
jgi:hypothetical protein